MLWCALALCVAPSWLAGPCCECRAAEPFVSNPLSEESPSEVGAESIWSRPLDDAPETLPEDVVRIDQPLGEPLPDPNAWTWHWAPTGLIYHSYMAGVHEPHLALFTFSNLDDRFLWDATLGGRFGLVRYGNEDPIHPAGYQLDFYGAAIPRLDAGHKQDLESADYVFGFPLTFGDEQCQWKCGYTHLSSHLGDELAIRVPSTLAHRVNYVRDSFVLGTSRYPLPGCRLYAEGGWAFHTSGGAKPLEFQLGTEISEPGPTSCWIPFVALNGRMRQEHDFGGDMTLQIGWLQRGILAQTLRLGAQYYNGKSSQFEFFKRYEQQLGLGIWYDF